MATLATVADVRARLRPAVKHLATDDEDYTAGLIAEASVKVLAHLGKSESYHDTEPVPSAVTIVTSRAVARVLEQNSAGVVAGTQQSGTTAGPFSQQRTFVAGSGSGSPWLTRSDRADLDNAYGANKAFGRDRIVTTTTDDVPTTLLYGTPVTTDGD